DYGSGQLRVDVQQGPRGAVRRSELLVLQTAHQGRDGGPAPGPQAAEPDVQVGAGSVLQGIGNGSHAGRSYTAQHARYHDAAKRLVVDGLAQFSQGRPGGGA